VIEDDRAVQKALTRLFEAEGFAVDVAGNGPPVWRCSGQRLRPCSCCLSLPGTPARVCREIARQRFVPISFSSAKTEVMDKVSCLSWAARLRDQAVQSARTSGASAHGECGARRGRF